MDCRGLSVRDLLRGVCAGDPWMDSPGSWQPSWGTHIGVPFEQPFFNCMNKMLPLSSPARIIYPRAKDEFSQEASLSETRGPQIYCLPFVLMELGLKVYVWGFMGSWLWLAGVLGDKQGGDSCIL